MSLCLCGLLAVQGELETHGIEHRHCSFEVPGMWETMLAGHKDVDKPLRCMALPPQLPMPCVNVLHHHAEHNAAHGKPVRISEWGALGSYQGASLTTALGKPAMVLARGCQPWLFMQQGLWPPH